ncbi:hypothetical protein ASD08_38040 [Streptomyces sp. Root369]|nr:hypothetical protein ASD08_38040 [Streptomyces sp. Root369]
MIILLAQQLFDLVVGDLLPTVDALRVAAKQDLDAVARTFGDLGCVDPGVEPSRQRRVPKVVRAGGEWRGDGGRGKSQGASLLPPNYSPAFMGEEPSVAGHPEGVEVIPQARDEVRRDWHRPDLFHGPVLEASVVVGFAGVGPLLADAGTSAVQQCR